MNNTVPVTDYGSSDSKAQKTWVLDYRCTCGNDCHDVAKDLDSAHWTVHRVLIDKHAFRAFNSKMTRKQAKEYSEKFSKKPEIYDVILYSQ